MITLVINMLMVFLTAVHRPKLCLLIAGRGEERFEYMLAERDFAVLRMPVEMLHEEYRDGQYRVLRICKRGG